MSSARSREHCKAPAAPQNHKCFDTEQWFLISHSDIAAAPKEQQKLPRQEQKAGEEQGHLVVLGAEDAEQLSPVQEGNALFRAYAIENADSDRPKEFTDACQAG